MTIPELQKKIEEINDTLFCEDVNPRVLVGNIFPEIVAALSDFIRLIPELNRCGLEFDASQVLDRLKRLETALMEYNRIAVFDCLNFEIADSLASYREILTIMNEEG